MIFGKAVLSENAKTAFAEAIRHAQENNHPVVGSEDLLWALFQKTKNDSKARYWLSSQRIGKNGRKIRHAGHKRNRAGHSRSSCLLEAHFARRINPTHQCTPLRDSLLSSQHWPVPTLAESCLVKLRLFLSSLNIPTLWRGSLRLAVWLGRLRPSFSSLSFTGRQCLRSIPTSIFWRHVGEALGLCFAELQSTRVA
jgi:hypothetical protein